MKPDGSGARKLTPGYDFLPSGWSPDGGKIMYHGLVDSNKGDYLMNPDGSGKRKVTRISSDLDGGSRGGESGPHSVLRTGTRAESGS